MMKKLLWILMIIVFTPCIALAQSDVILELEGRFWFTDLEGRVKVTEADLGTDINLKRDLDLKDEGYPEVRLTWYTGKKSKIRVGYTQVDYEGDASLQRTILFKGTTYSVGTRVVTDLEIKYLRIGWAWQFICMDSGLIKLGTLIEGKGFWTKATLEAPDLVPAIREKESFIFALPTVGAALDINPHPMVNIFAEGSGLPAGKYGHMYDVEAGIKLIPVRILSIMGGYRLLEFKAKDDRDFAKARVQGPFVGVTVRF
ncbi:MAG: hypothetical protein ACUVWO_02075 [Thermodesulfobacteriota bacterium]